MILLFMGIPPHYRSSNGELAVHDRQCAYQTQETVSGPEPIIIA